MKSPKDMWISIKEISLKYAIPVDTLSQWCREGTIPSEFAEIRGKYNSWHINVGALAEKAEIRYFFEQETGQGLDEEDIENMTVFGLNMKPRK